MKKDTLPKYVVIKNNKWHIRRVYFQNGKRKEIWRRCKIETEDFAKLLSDKIQSEIELKLDPSLRSEKSLKNFFAFWFKKKVKKKTAIRTQELYKANFDKHFADIENLRLSEIKPQNIQNIIDTLEEKGHHRTAQQVHALIRLIYNDARKMNIYSGDNPANQMFPPTYQMPEADCLNRKQVKKLLAAAETFSNGIVINFALETAMRPGEIFGLKWKHVDFKKKKIFVREQIIFPKGGGHKFTKPKWSQTRNITISNNLITALKLHKKAQSKNYLGLVFPAKNNKPMRPKNFARRDFKKMLKKAKLSQSLSPYCLRHTTATLLLQSKQPLKYVSSLLGHSNINITAKIYAHYIPEMEDEISKAIQGMIY